jgi:exopolyphosphatase/pppGpp-phosphohydrolase
MHMIPTGIVGDLGGGSLELVGVKSAARIGEGVTLPLGGLAPVRTASGGSPKPRPSASSPANTCAPPTS